MIKRLLPVILFVTSQAAFALNLQSFRFADSYRYSLLEDSYQVKFKGPYVLAAGLGYTNSPFYVSDPDVTRLDNEIINYQYTLALTGTYYLNSQLNVGMDINGNHNEVFNETHSSLGDTVLRLKWNLYRESQFSFALNPKLYLPTGETANFTTINSMGASVSGIGEYKHETWHFLASVGFFHGGNNEFLIVDYRNLVLTTLGVSHDLNADWTINGEAIKNFTTNRDYRQDEGDYYLTFKYKMHPLAGLYFGAGLAGTDDIDRNNYTIFAGLKVHQ